jgi:hypothetical protein
MEKCLECQQVKDEHKHPVGLLQPQVIPKSNNVFYCWISTGDTET